jgi:hypothetical protein
VRFVMTRNTTNLFKPLTLQNPQPKRGHFGSGNRTLAEVVSLNAPPEP